MQRQPSSFPFHRLTYAAVFHLFISVIISFPLSSGPRRMLDAYRITAIIITSYSSVFATSVCDFTTAFVLLLLFPGV
jgi:hypothetical protein